MNDVPSKPTPLERDAAVPPPGTGRGGGVYRVRYRIQAPFVVTGHRDLMDTLFDCFRRAELPVTMSDGSSRPKVSFGPPLPAGCTGDGEFLDLDLNDSVLDLVKRLNSVFPQGIEAVSAERIGTKSPAVSSLIGSIVYEYAIPPDVMAFEDVKNRLVRFAAERIWQVQHTTNKGKERTVNLKMAVLDWSVSGDSGKGAVASITTKYGDPDGNNAHPQLILSGLFHFDEEQSPRVGLRRVAFFDANDAPLQNTVWRRKRGRHMRRKSYEYLRFLDQ